MKKKFLALVMACVMAVSMVGCSAANDGVNYSLGLADTGFFEGITATDYVTLPDDFESVSVAAEDIVVEESSVKEFVSYIESNYGTETDVTDRDAQLGDWVSIDYVGSVDGVEFSGGKAEGYALQLGSHTFIDDFEEQIVGHKTGESFDVTVTFPENYGDSTDADGNPVALSGREAVFHVTLQRIYTYVLTDEQVKEVFNTTSKMWDGTLVETVEQVEEYGRENKYWSAVESVITTYLNANSVIDEVPEKLLNNQVTFEKQYAEYLAESYGLSSADALAENYGYESIDAYIESNLYYLEDSVKYYLMVQAVAETLEIEVTDEDIAAYTGDTMQEQLDTYGRGYVSQNVLCYKVMRHLCNSAIIEE